MMTIQLVDLRRSFVWLRTGWTGFATNLGGWLALSILFMLVVLLLSMLPFAGLSLIMLLMPFFLTGLLVTAHKSTVDSLAQVEDMLLGFHDRRLRLPLLWLGMWMVAGTLLIFLILYPLSWIAINAWYVTSPDGNVTAAALEMLNASPVRLLVQGGVIVVVVMVFFYAPPLLIFANMTPLESMLLSLQACLKNILPLLLFGIMTLVLGILASFVFGLGFMVLIPILSGASYASFCDVFGASDAKLAIAVPT
jgi:hypothetical protein